MPGKTIGTAVRDWLSRIGATRRARSGRESGRQIPAWLSPLGEPVDRTEFAARLGKILSRQRAIPAGQINVIGLDDLRDRLGDRWAEIEAKAHEVCGRIIRANLSDLDVYTRYSNDEYLIIFGRLSADAARLKCATIKQEIVSHFLGDPDMETIAIKVVVERLEGALLFEEMTLKDLLKPLVKRTELPPQPSPAPLPAAPQPRKQDMVFVGFAPMQDGAAPTLDEPGKRRRPIEFVYRPFWDLQHGVISTYFCLPRVPHAAGGHRYGYDILPEGAAAARIATLDFQTVRRGLKSLNAVLKAQNRVMMAVMVHFETLAMPRSRDRYTQILRSVPPGMRDFLIFELCGLPPGVAQLRVATMVDRLRPFCRWVLVRSGFRRRVGRYEGLGVHAVGVDLGKDSRDERAIAADMEHFARLAEASRLRSYAHNVTSASLAVQARAAGFIYLSGDRISPVTAMPKYMVKLDWPDFYLGRGLEETPHGADMTT